MPEFLQLLPPQEAFNRLLEFLPPYRAVEASEPCNTLHALGRVTAEPVYAPQPLPSFMRSTVDGFAVRAADTYGASEGIPAYLRLAGEVPMGKPAGTRLGTGKCALIHTGGMLPEGADAVVMVEYTQSVGQDEVEVYRAVAAGENVLMVGEDVSEGQEVIPAGKRLRPADIGGLMASGILQLPVMRRPRVGIFSSGDEVVPPETTPGPGQVRDVNLYTLSALVVEAGGEPRRYGILPDQAEALYQAARPALEACDLLVITAGSSASTRDLTAQVINRLGQPGVLVHGVDVRPGKPTILAVCGGKAVVGLPGNPVSALVIASLFVAPLIRTLLGLPVKAPRACVPARLTINLPSQAGREDWVPVRLILSENGYQAEPVFGKSNLIFTLSRADGLVRIPPDANGLDAGEAVEVFLL
ncbi:MAG: gephyrin-like molybdotransferase Glp [Omnitrophica WOR_2 bacterium]